MTLVGLACRFLRSRGFQIFSEVSMHTALGRRGLLLKKFGITHVLDVGANAGQYATQLRKAGYTGQIISFEPLTGAFTGLQALVADDPQWKVVHTAIGNTAGTVEINIAANSFSSSVLGMMPMHEKIAPQSVYTGKETVPLDTIDHIVGKYDIPLSTTLLKIDTQGFEKKVLDGAIDSLNLIDTVQLEMSLVPLYQGEVLFTDLHLFMEQKGYRLVAGEPEFFDEKTGELYQIDCIYHRYR